MTHDYINDILKFNTDPEIVALREKYSEPSFFEVISKDRSETVYSSFLKWLFQDCANGRGAVSPIMQLLNILVKRVHYKKNDELIESKVQHAILSGAVKIKDIKVETELSISEYHERLNEENGKLEKQNLNRGNKDSKNRLDIFIDCNIEIPKVDNGYSRLQVIIENKIDSSHGDNQTGRYYDNTKREGKNIIQLYVYLTPEGAKEDDSIDPHYIHITYKDILDSIINPLLSSISISSRSRFFLEEFKTQLSFPNPETGQTSIATSTESIDIFDRIYEKFQTLIRDSAIAYTGLIFIIEENKLKVATKTKDSVIEIKGHDELICFWEQNDKLLLSIMNGMSGRGEVEELIKQVSKRPKSKYKIYCGDTPLNKKDEPVGNAIAAKIIIQACVDKLVEAGEEVTLDVLRDKIPRAVNPYYHQWHPNLFEYLFYEYKPQATGTKNDTPENGYVYDCQDSKLVVTKENTWDIDFNEEKKNKHIIHLTKSTGKESDKTEHKVIMLKMWQKSAVEKLINYILELKDNHGKKLLPRLKIEEVANNRVINTWSSSKE